ncbi:MAG: ornithine carbamoyltransferase [Gemmatimonadota bacterium]
MMADTRHFLAIPDFETDELYQLLDLAHRLKSGEEGGKPLAGKTLGMIFQKSSTRTRVSFEVGTYQLGGHALFLSARDLQLGRGEPLKDTARVLSRYVDGVMIRTFDQNDLVELAHYGTIPVINGLTDLLHPCQVMADVMTIQEEFGRDLSGKKVAWIGDGNNMANSWLNAAYRFGLEVRIATPEGFEPDKEIYERARGAATVMLTHDPSEAADGADVVTTDVFASMGQEAEQQERLRIFKGFQVDDAIMEAAGSDSIFLHCLPAHRGEEVSESVFEGGRSRVWDEAENRLHAQKAIMATLMGV